MTKNDKLNKKFDRQLVKAKKKGHNMLLYHNPIGDVLLIINTKTPDKKSSWLGLDRQWECLGFEDDVGTRFVDITLSPLRGRYGSIIDSWKE